MGVCTFTLRRSKPAHTAEGTAIYRSAWAAMARDESCNRTAIKRADHIWGHAGHPTVLYTPHGKPGDDIQDGAPVYELDTARQSAWTDYDPAPGALVGFYNRGSVVTPAMWLRSLSGAIEGKLRQHCPDVDADVFAHAWRSINDDANTGALFESEALHLIEIIGGCDRLRAWYRDDARPWVHSIAQPDVPGTTVHLDELDADDDRTYHRTEQARSLAERLWRLVDPDRRRVAPALSLDLQRLLTEHAVTRADGNKFAAVERGTRVLSIAGTPGVFNGTTGPVVFITWDGNADKTPAFDRRFPLAALYPFRADKHRGAR